MLMTIYKCNFSSKHNCLWCIDVQCTLLDNIIIFDSIVNYLEIDSLEISPTCDASTLSCHPTP